LIKETLRYGGELLVISLSPMMLHAVHRVCAVQGERMEAGILFGRKKSEEKSIGNGFWGELYRYDSDWRFCSKQLWPA
jgi:hypothetical protein